MPEQISKYPEVTLQVLKGAGGRCGAGVEQKILTQCAPERFCSFASGEVCIFGLEHVSQLTQIEANDLAGALRTMEGGMGLHGAGGLTATFVVGFLAGVLACWRVSKRKRASRR